jgi:hypothetical protein
MNLPARASIAFFATLAGVSPSGVRAAELGCPGMSVATDAGFRERHPDLLARIHSEFAARTDVDPCARVEIGVDGGSIRVSVTLPDGRAASRSVTRSDDLVPSLQALLIVPDGPAVASNPAPRPSAPASPAAPAYRPHSDRFERNASILAPSPRTLGFELAVISGARVGDGQLGFGAGVLSLLEVRSWLLGFEGRIDAYRPLLGGDPGTVLELGILAGRRFDFGSVALDVTIGPAVAMKDFAVTETENVSVQVNSTAPAPAPAPPPPPPTKIEEDPSTGPAPRLLLGARLGFRPRSTFRPFLGLDGELGPSRIALDAGPTASRLPTYVVGLAFGASVGTP